MFVYGTLKKTIIFEYKTVNRAFLFNSKLRIPETIKKLETHFKILNLRIYFRENYSILVSYTKSSTRLESPAKWFTRLNGKKYFFRNCNFKLIPLNLRNFLLETITEIKIYNFDYYPF